MTFGEGEEKRKLVKLLNFLIIVIKTIAQQHSYWSAHLGDVLARTDRRKLWSPNEINRSGPSNLHYIPRPQMQHADRRSTQPNQLIAEWNNRPSPKYLGYTPIP